MGIIVNQYKDPYKPISIMECHKGFERCSNGYKALWDRQFMMAKQSTFDLLRFPPKHTKRGIFSNPMTDPWDTYMNGWFLW